MAFDALEAAVELAEALAPIEKRIRAQRKSLAEQIGRAAESIALNLGEGRMRIGLDGPDLWRRAEGSAAEVTVALRVARVRGYVTADELVAVDALLDRLRAMLWRLTHKRPAGRR